MISRDEAEQIATAYLKAAFESPKGLVSADIRRSHEPSISAVRDLHEVDRPPVLVYWQMMTTSVDECWIAYVTPRHLALQASEIVLVSKESGEVVYFGSANDEG